MHDISAVHIISHGADGEVQLGGATLNFDSLLNNASQVKGWGQALTPGADILIYGCDVAEYADGKALVNALSRLTGADVAASEDLTGAANKGGNWTLEYDTGHIDAALAISATEQATWNGVLQGVAVGGETLVNTTTAGRPTDRSGAERKIGRGRAGRQLRRSLERPRPWGQRRNRRQRPGVFPPTI